MLKKLNVIKLMQKKELENKTRDCEQKRKMIEGTNLAQTVSL